MAPALFGTRYFCKTTLSRKIMPVWSHGCWFVSQIGIRYLVHIRLNADSPGTTRLEEAAAGVKEVLEGLVSGNHNCQPLYMSRDCAYFGFALKTTALSATIRALLKPSLLGEHSILIVEVGEHRDGLCKD